MPEGRKTVFVVDDEPDVLTYLVAALEDASYEARAFSSPEGFLDAVRRDPPDLICLDIMMPGESGLSLFRELRSSEDLRDIPVLIVSGYSQPDESLEQEFGRLVGDGGISGPEGFVDKPLSLPGFLAMVQEQLGGGNGGKQ